MRKVAIISTNRNKYSETFIQMQIKELPNVVLVLADGYLPSTYSVDRGKHFKDLLEEKKWWQKSSSVAGIKRILLKEKIEVVLAEYGQSGVEMAPICDALGIALVVHFHGFDAYRNDAISTYGKKYPYMFEAANAIIAVSNDMRNQLIDLGCPEQKIQLIPYGVNPNVFKPIETERNLFQFVACGRFVAKKNPLATIKAFHKVWLKHPSSKLVMIGDGELMEKAKKMVQKLDLVEAIEFTGVLEPAQVAEKLNQSVAFVQHSVKTEENDCEGTPLSILEAMSCKLPVIATKHGGIIDVIHNDVNGYLVEQNDVDGMAQLMLEVIENPELTNQIGERARRTILDKYTKDRYLSQLANLLNGC